MLGRLPPIESKERPVINSTYIPAPYMGEPRSLDLDTLVYWVKKTPECIGIIKRIATDIVTEYDFISVASQASGRPNKSFHKKVEEKAHLFAEKNFLRQKLLSAVTDWIITGDAYIWMGKVSEKQISEIAARKYDELGITGDVDDASTFYDEDWNGINSIEVVPSSMVEIYHDDIKINKYIQKSKTNPENDRRFDPDEIIHAKFLDIDGKVYGYSPMESSFTAIKTINAIQDYSYNYFANGVKLDRAWLISGSVNQTYIDKLESMLKKYKSVAKARGDLVIAGGDKISVEKLNEASEEMEYRQLAINAVGRLAFAFNMPADILSAILGVDVKGTAMGSDIEDAGYNRNIIQSQKYWENIMNSQLWDKFKVHMTLERTFRQDQIRQIQYQTQAVTFAEFLFKHEYPVSDEYIHSLLQIPRKFLNEGTIKREIEVQMKSPLQAPVKGGNSEKFADSKKKQQEPQERNNPPIGS